MISNVKSTVTGLLANVKNGAQYVNAVLAKLGDNRDPQVIIKIV